MRGESCWPNHPGSRNIEIQSLRFLLSRYTVAVDPSLHEHFAPPSSKRSKAGRNERKKLTAALFNNLSAAALVASVLQPALTILRQERPTTINDYVAVLVFGLIGLTFHTLSQIVATGLED